MTGTQVELRYSSLRRCLFSVGSALLALFLFVGQPAQAQTFTVLHRFHGKGDGRWPLAGVLQNSIGNLYGTTMKGGAFERGTVFKIDAQGKETVLHSFWGGDGAIPEADLIQDKSGNLYGTTWAGGTGSKYYGTVFKLDSAGEETVLYAFTGGADGRDPIYGLIRDHSGNLYGATPEGGDSACDPVNGGCGVVFKLNKKAKETVLHAFTGAPDGWVPSGGLIRDKGGNLYGTTWYGGASGKGTVFKLDPAGNETVLYSFMGTTDGESPDGPLVQDAAGNLYGVASGGGSSCGCGVVFRVDPTGKETVLYAFTGKADGAYPEGGLIRDSKGNLYGAAQFGGSTLCADGCGTIFKVDTNGKETVLHSFTGGKGGFSPNRGPTMDKSGALYGTTYYGGDSSCYSWPTGAGCGVVFKLTP